MGEASSGARRVALLLVVGLRVDGEAYAAAFRLDGRVDVAATAVSCEDAVRAARSSRHEVVLLHVRGAEGIAVAHRLRQLDQAARLVVCGVTDDGRELAAWASAGVLGYVGRDASFEELVSAIVLASRGEPSGSALLAEALFRRTVTLARAESLASNDIVSALTRRERQVLELIAEGLSNKQIAKTLLVEISTVKNHLHNIFRKLGVRNRAEAVRRSQSSTPLDENGGTN